jgi:hypothetical protein
VKDCETTREDDDDDDDDTSEVVEIVSREATADPNVF